VTDRIVLRNIRLEGRHGYDDEEREAPQPFEVDVELVLDLQPAGIAYDIVKGVVESTSYRLLEALAEAISREILAAFRVAEIGVRVRKPAVRLGGPLDYAGVEIWRRPT